MKKKTENATLDHLLQIRQVPKKSPKSIKNIFCTLFFRANDSKWLQMIFENLNISVFSCFQRLLVNFAQNLVSWTHDPTTFTQFIYFCSV